jgi:multiple sugar transport system ATP-binding protein
MASVKLENVYKYYYSGKKLINAVQNLNLAVKDGEIVSILGPSGCGKSSTMRMIAGLEQITEGSIYFDGVRVNDRTPDQRNIALAFESYALYQHFTVKENISYCLKVGKCDKSEQESRIAWISDLLGLHEIIDTKPLQLSGGQQQLVSLARALIRKPSVTLLDEPISHLDTKTRVATSLKIRQIHNQTGLTMVYVTHNQEEALALADRIAVMNVGELQQLGDRIDIIQKPKNLFVAGFVGEPPINFIRCSLRKGAKGVLYAESADGSFRCDVDRERAGEMGRRSLGEVVAGVRPVDLYESPARGRRRRLRGKVVYFECLGETGNVKLSVGENTQIVAVVNADLDVSKDDVMSLYFDQQQVHFFDPKTQLRIGAE